MVIGVILVICSWRVSDSKSVLTKFDPTYFEVIGKHLQLSYLWRVHGRDIFRVPHALSLSISF